MVHHSTDTNNNAFCKKYIPLCTFRYAIWCIISLYNMNHMMSLSTNAINNNMFHQEKLQKLRHHNMHAGHPIIFHCHRHFTARQKDIHC